VNRRFYVEAPYDPAGGGPPLPNDFGWSGHFRANTTTFPVATAFETRVLITRLPGVCPPRGSDASSIDILV
jgi:hypothetical protein